MTTHFIIPLFFISSIFTVQSATSPGDVAALIAFKSAVKPSSIPPTSCLATWNFTVTDPCSVPRTTHFTCGITCSGRRVIQLTLDSQSYSGTLTPLVSKLTRLITLDLSDNAFSGAIPAAISDLPSLKTLILRANFFAGSIPPLTNLKSLETLDFSHNSLSGPLPDMNSLTGLANLDLSYNNLSGNLPILPPNLKELAMKSNSLSGFLSASSFSGLALLMVLELSENMFSGNLDYWVFLLPSLQQVNLSNNSFATIAAANPPRGFSSDLVAINLSFNNIEGPLPVNFTAYPTLRSLALSHNRFRGAIPEQFGAMGSLQRLYLDGNYLNGSPPAGLFGGGGPVSGSLGDNCLETCPISSELCSKLQKPKAVCQQAYGGKHS